MKPCFKTLTPMPWAKVSCLNTLGWRITNLAAMFYILRQNHYISKLGTLCLDSRDLCSKIHEMLKNVPKWIDVDKLIRLITKRSFISWLAFMERLPTKARLSSCGTDVNGGCKFCDNQETRDHLFLEWPYSRKIRKDILQMLCGSAGLNFKSR